MGGEPGLFRGGLLSSVENTSLCPHWQHGVILQTGEQSFSPVLTPSVYRATEILAIENAQDVVRHGNSTLVLYIV